MSFIGFLAATMNVFGIKFMKVSKRERGEERREEGGNIDKRSI